MFETTEELLKQIALGEDSALELKSLGYKGRKVMQPHRNSMADELAAMANSSNGVFVLGVEDVSRKIEGIPFTKLDRVEEWVRNICNDLIDPPLECLIRKVPVKAASGKESCLVRVDVPRSLFVHKSPGGYFRRIGSSKREMSTEVLARLFQQRSQARLIRFDEQIVPETGLQSLQESLWRRFKTALSPADDIEFLSKIKFLSRDETGALRATVGGLLMGSEAPEGYLRSAYIQAVCYNSTERNATYQLDAMDICGPLDVQIREACKFVARNMKTSAYKNPYRIDVPQFSMNAVFEAVVNAVAHRDYSIYGSKIRLHIFSNRLELFSPGTIPDTMTLESIAERQSSRNELLTSFLARCPMNVEVPGSERNFIMDKRGEGVPIILAESERLASRSPEYRVLDDAEVVLTMFAGSAHEVNYLEVHEGGCERAHEEAHEADLAHVRAHEGGKTGDLAHGGAQVGAHEEAHVESETALSALETKMLTALLEGELEAKELIPAAGQASRSGSFKRSLKKLLEARLVEMTNPEHPRARNQKYRITPRGMQTVS